MNEKSMSEEEVCRQERAEAARAQYRAQHEAEVAASEAEEAADHARALAMEQRIASVMSVCLTALNSLADGTAAVARGDIDEARERVLRSLRAIYFPQPESALNVVLDQLLPQIQPVLESYFDSLGSRPPAPAYSGYNSCVGCAPMSGACTYTGTPIPPPSDLGFDPNDLGSIQRAMDACNRVDPRRPLPGIPMSDADLAAMYERLRVKVPFTVDPHGTVTPPPAKPKAPETRVEQYWENIAGSLSTDELLEVSRLALGEADRRPWTPR